MKILDGKALSGNIFSEIKNEVNDLKERTGKVPGLTVIIAGDDPASSIYVKTKDKKAKITGIRSNILRYDKYVKGEVLKNTLKDLNTDPETDAVLVQLPLPKGLDTWDILQSMDPKKDVDGFHPENLGKVMLNESEIFPCTPFGIMRLLDESDIDPEGMNCVVVGRSFIVGKPVAAMLTNKNATVTLCHSKTKNLGEIVTRADMVIAALGKPGFIKAEMVKRDAVLIDVGMNYLDKEEEVTEYCNEDQIKRFYKKGYGITGDIHPESFFKSSYYTPVPGGVGPMTVAMLMYNTLHLFKKRIGEA